jgi:uncharacterized membrane-anchored protein
MTGARKLLIVVAVQFAILLSVIGFKQYTEWTSTTILLRTAPVDPSNLTRSDFIALRYEISSIDRSTVTGDQCPGGDVYVELRRGGDGYWSAVAIHDRQVAGSFARTASRMYSDSVLIKGTVQFGDCRGKIDVHYGIEQVFIPEGNAGQLPTGSGHTVAVEAKVDRFGNAAPRRFLVDGAPFKLERR